jgi:integral membrane sensor domain MASE1/anti-sigma regulatory factor (Ser/Thr protein kinase)
MPRPSVEAPNRVGGFRPVLYLGQVALVALVYWGAARLSLDLALVRGQVTPIWPPTGIAVVTFLALGYRMWPAIAIGALAVNLPLGPSAVGAVVIAFGNTLAPLASAWLLRRAHFRNQLDRLRDAIAIVFLGALAGMTVSATIGSTVLTLSGAVPMSSFAGTWAVWWAGDAMGVLLVAPMLLAFARRPGVRPFGWRRSVELALLLCAVGVVTYLLLNGPYRIEYLVLPLIAVAAWRFRLAGAAPAALVASVIAATAAVSGEGPFASETLVDKMVTLQAFNISLSLSSFVLAAYADTRQRSEDLSRLYFSASQALAAKNDVIDVALADIGPPIAVLTSYMEVLSSGNLGPPPERWEEILSVMADKAWQVNRLIDELLEAARIEAAPDSPSRDYLDLREAVQGAATRAGARAEVSGAQISASYGPDSIPVDADRRQIARILDNLINNSLTYVTKPPRIQLDAEVDGNRALVRVIDNGVGLTESQRSRVFEPFERMRDPEFTEVPGVGLGLFASKKLAQVNNGTLTLERTEPGVGSCFTLQLPLAIIEKARNRPKNEDPKSRPAPRPRS